MRIIELTANKASFKPVRFNPSGMSVIMGKMSPENVADRSKTYNSVGKSLIIRIIHFCLGSNPYNDFTRELSDWEFTLKFKVEEEEYWVRRKVDNQGKITLNGDEMSTNSYRNLMEQKVFDISEPIPHLKFRPLISRFIRPRKGSYISYGKYVPKEQEYGHLLCNSYLLGLDIDRVVKKHDLRKDFDDTDKLKKNISKDPIFRDFFVGDKDFSVDIADLEVRIGRLEGKIRDFEIAEDYYQIKKEADNLTTQVANYKNQAFSLRNAVQNINKSIEISPDIPKDRIFKLYEEANQVFPEIVQRKVDEVIDFNEKILKDRLKRLNDEKSRLAAKLETIEESIMRLGKQRDQKLQYLNGKGALDEYTALNNQLSDLKIKLEKLQTHQNLINEYKNKLENIRIDLNNENIATRKYITESKDLINRNISLFKDFTDAFYEDKVAGIEVSNNDGNNQLRFNINARIQDDSGDGVNKVKIFCFDWTLLRGGYNHKVQFLYHDSIIIDGLDPRQRATLFELAYKYSTENNYQYIINANQDALESMRDYLGDKFGKIVYENVILELTDESSETKLLGIQVDLDDDS